MLSCFSHQLAERASSIVTCSACQKKLVRLPLGNINFVLLPPLPPLVCREGGTLCPIAEVFLFRAGLPQPWSLRDKRSTLLRLCVYNVPGYACAYARRCTRVLDAAFCEPRPFRSRLAMLREFFRELSTFFPRRSFVASLFFSSLLWAMLVVA